MSMELFGTLPTGEDIYKFTLSSGDSTASVISYGATLSSFRPFGREIVGGFDTLPDYLANKAYHGATVGRVCNRIVGAEFELDGVTYKLSKNNGENCLHGGADGFHNKAWSVISYGENFVKLGYRAMDGQSGFPGNIDVVAEYTLLDSSIVIEYRAIPDKKTPIMMTNHTYFNLGGFAGDVLGTRVKIYAERYTEVDENRFPTGRQIEVAGCPLDFSGEKNLGEKIEEDILFYDHNFIITPSLKKSFLGRELGLGAEATGDGLCLATYTNQPGIQFYLVKNPSKSTPAFSGGATQLPHGAFCFETQIEPNCVKRGVGFVDAGEEYISTTVYSVTKA